jgi:alkylation response protein AidB-like acyl-CoA dehydrogenase
MATPSQKVDEVQLSREVAEQSRETEWKGAGFLRDLFLGQLRIELIHPYPLEGSERPEFVRFYAELERFLKETVDPAKIDELGDYPAEVLDGLRKLGAFGMKIPTEYGGLGMNQVEYGKAMALIGSRDANLTALLSAHQSIGVPQPLKMFGSDELKKKYLPRCARGAISAFALTEAMVGSDPARLSTTYELSPDGKSFVLNGVKLWCTNGTIAELLVVMAKHPKSGAISAFVVEANSPGIEVTHRCHFMGLRALANAAIKFTDVKVPKENILGAEGRGLKIALTTLNTGRLSLPAAVAGLAKNCLELCRKWSAARVQWGHEIGKHEAIAHKLADMASTVYAMEAVSDLAQALADKKGYDIRLEAAAAKEWNTVQAWRLIDETMQIRGGRGYETEASLAARGEKPVGVERWMRDNRINLIFEGSSEIMHLFMGRELVDKHLQVAGVMIDKRAPLGKKLAALPKIAMFYAVWYVKQWLGFPFRPWYGGFGPMAKHLRFVERSSRKVARQVFHGMMIFQARMERKQAFLFRCVDIANELFAMSASISRAQTLARAGRPEAREAQTLALAFCAKSRARVQDLFRDLWHNGDDAKFALGKAVLDGRHAWLEQGAMELGVTVEDLRPKVPVKVGPRTVAEPPRSAAAADVSSAVVVN